MYSTRWAACKLRGGPAAAARASSSSQARTLSAGAHAKPARESTPRQGFHGRPLPRVRLAPRRWPQERGIGGRRLAAADPAPRRQVPPRPCRSTRHAGYDWRASHRALPDLPQAQPGARGRAHWSEARPPRAGELGVAAQLARVRFAKHGGRGRRSGPRQRPSPVAGT